MVCVLRGGFSRVEQTLLDGGAQRGGDPSANGVPGRDALAQFTGVIEEATGRPVIGFMSGNQQDPDLMCRGVRPRRRRTSSMRTSFPGSPVRRRPA